MLRVFGLIALRTTEIALEYSTNCPDRRSRHCDLPLEVRHRSVQVMSSTLFGFRDHTMHLSVEVDEEDVDEEVFGSRCTLLVWPLPNGPQTAKTPS